MISIDLLSLSGKPDGSRRTESGFEVIEPWGRYDLRDIELPGGWYALTVGGSALVLRLYQDEECCSIELEAKDGQPAYVYLVGGRYKPSLMAGSRPGVYTITSAHLRGMAPWRRYSLLFRRLVQAVSSGMSLADLWQRARQAFGKRRTYGIKASQTRTESSLGMLSRQDWPFDRDRLNVKERLGRIGTPPVFLLESIDGAPVPASVYGDQIYGHFTLDPLTPHDFIVSVRPTDRLLADALLVFAEYLQRHPDKRIVLCDKWIRQVPTANVAWDPILYDSGLPTPYARIRGVEAKADFSNRADFGIVGIPLAVTECEDDSEDYAERHRLRGSERPPCSIIIPTRDRSDLLENCLAGLFDKTHWPHEVIVVDNGSVEAATFALFEKYAPSGLKVVPADMPFNFSALCNLGAAAASHDYLLFLNNDVVLFRPEWLEKMMFYGVKTEVGAVGARLLYADGRLQHGGIMLGLTQACGHLWRGASKDLQSRHPRLRFSSLRSAVTGACFLVNRAKFEAVGGFDTEHFPVTLNDVDLCLKLLQRGYCNLFAAQAEAFHLEGESRGPDEDPDRRARRKAELMAFQAKWKTWIEHDPWLPDGVGRATETFLLR